MAYDFFLKSKCVPQWQNIDKSMAWHRVEATQNRDRHNAINVKQPAVSSSAKNIAKLDIAQI